MSNLIFKYLKASPLSNIPKSALTSGIEWNYRITKNGHEDDFDYYKNTFENLFYNNSIIVDDMELEKYSNTWKKFVVHTKL
ncbi:phospholipase D-like domain-containing protein [Tepidibacter formicigenes]|uniref:hypothetical protein n=1 Tax=Tepidibacter formicigenes TaxID=227138 RepID=UPI00093549E6|nr:hypothetical protein [Tepidibacter formicigenes]